MLISELFAKLEAGYVLEFYTPNYPSHELNKERFMGLYYRAPEAGMGGYYERFGWGSATGTLDDVLFSIVKHPERWGCLDKKPADYNPEFA